MLLIPSEGLLVTMKYHPPTTIKTVSSKDFREDVFDLDNFTSCPNVTSYRKPVYKLFCHPKGSNIFYPLSREYIYHQNQKNYFNNQYLFTSFLSLNIIISFVRGNRYNVFHRLRSYEDLLIVRAYIPRGSKFIKSRDGDCLCSNRLVIEKDQFYDYSPYIIG